MTVTERGQLPKAYLRLDPNIDHKHPDNLDGFVRLLCAANRQVPRGRFRARAVIDSLFGKTATDRFYRRGDIRNATDGAVDVVGWEQWQEGDLSVAERMRKYRESRVTDTVTEAVTVPSPDRIPASKDSKTVDSKTFTPSIEGGAAGKPRPPSPVQKVKTWLRDHDLAQPVGWEVSKVNELARLPGGSEAVIAAFEEARDVGGAITTRNYVRWAEQSLAPDPAPRNGAAPKPPDEAAARFNRGVAATQREMARMRGEA